MPLERARRGRRGWAERKCASWLAREADGAAREEEERRKSEDGLGSRERVEASRRRGDATSGGEPAPPLARLMPGLELPREWMLGTLVPSRSGLLGAGWAGGGKDALAERGGGGRANICGGPSSPRAIVWRARSPCAAAEGKWAAEDGLFDGRPASWCARTRATTATPAQELSKPRSCIGLTLHRSNTQGASGCRRSTVRGDEEQAALRGDKSEKKARGQPSRIRNHCALATQCTVGFPEPHCPL